MTIIATDASIFDQMGQDMHPPSLISKIFFENEVSKPQSYFENANLYVQDFLSTSDAIYLDLLFGVQSWRKNIFNLESLYKINSSIA